MESLTLGNARGLEKTYPCKTEASENNKRPPANVVNGSRCDLHNNDYIDLQRHSVYLVRILRWYSQTHIQLTKPANAWPRARIRVVVISLG